MSSENRRSRFWQTPNMVDDMKLSVHAFRLFQHFLRACGNNQTCKQSSRLLMKWCSMTPSKIVSAKRELVGAGLIEITKFQTRNGLGDEVSIPADIWRFNSYVYMEDERYLEHAADSKLKNKAREARKRHRELRTHLIGVPFPDDFSITSEMRDWAKETVPHVNIERETERFCDLLQGKNARMQNWVNFWKDWMIEKSTYRYDMS